MSNFINQTNSQYNMSASGYNKQNFQESLDKSKQTVINNVEENSTTQVLSGMLGSREDLKKNFALAIPLSYVDKYLVEKLYNGQGNKSILAKAANAGDKISSTLHLNSIISTKNVDRLKGRIKKNNFTKYFTSGYQAIPKSSMAMSESSAAKYGDALFGLFEKIKDNPELASKLYSGEALSETAKKVFESVGSLKGPVTREYLEKVQNVFVSDILPKLTAEKEVDAAKALLEEIGKHIAQIDAGAALPTGEISKQIASMLSYTKEAHPELLKGEGKKLLSSIVTPGAKPTIEETIKVAEEAASKGIEKIVEKRDIKSLSGSINKAKAASMKMGDTLLGKSLSKLSLGTKDALTYGGGIMSFFFVVSTLKEAIKAAKEAPKGEKKSAFAHEFANGYLGFLLLKPATSLCYKVGGNKYRGMTLEGREALKELVKKSNSTVGMSKEAIKVANIQKKLLINGVDKSKVAELAGKSLEEAKTMAQALKGEGAKLKFWEKPLKALGKVLDVGLDSIKKQRVVKLPIIGEKQLSLPTLKGFAGGLARFAIIMFVLQPIIQKPVEKLIHKIFGEPTQYLAQKKAKEEQAAANPNANATANPDANPNTNPNTQPAVTGSSTPDAQSVAPSTSTNLLERYSVKTPVANTPIAVQNDVTQNNQPADNDEIPLLGLGKDKNKALNGDSCSYVPSIEVKVDKKLEKQLQDNQDAIVDSLMQSSEKYLKNSKKFLK